MIEDSKGKNIDIPPEIIEICKEIPICCTFYKIAKEIDSVYVINATRALSEIFNKVKEILPNTIILIPWYAYHGKEHIEGLSNFFYEFMLKVSKTYEKKFVDILDLNCLLLLFSSFILHDIGMALMDKESSTEKFSVSKNEKKYINVKKFEDLSNIWKDPAIIREEHDKRSLRFIENEFIKPFRNEDFSNLTSWQEYWKRETSWSKPEGRYAMKLVHRICQSHGHNPDKWLKENFMTTFYPQELDNRQPSDILDDWHKDLHKQIKSYLMQGSALLCFSDLFEINPSRIELSKLIIDRILDDMDEKLETFKHWISHKVILKKEIKADKNKFIWYLQIIRNRNADRIPLLFFMNHGATKFTFKFGNHKRLKNAFKNCLDLPYDEIRIENLSYDDKFWNKTVNKKFEALKIHELDLIYELNKEISDITNDPFYLIFILKDITKYLTYEKRKISFIPFFKNFIEVRENGLLLEFCYKSTEGLSTIIKNNETKCFTLSISNHKKNIYYFANLFYAGFNIIIEIIKKGLFTVNLYHRKDIFIDFVEYPDPLYMELLSKNEISNFQNKIIFLFVKEPRKIHEYSKIITRVNSENNFKLYVIFICPEELALDLNKYGAKNISFDIKSNVIDCLKDSCNIISEYCYKQKLNKRQTDYIKKLKETSPAEIIYYTFQFAITPILLKQQIRENFGRYRNDKNDKKIKIDLLILLTIIELLYFEGKIVKKNDLQKIYNSIKELLEGLRFSKRYVEPKPFNELIGKIIKKYKMFLKIKSDNSLNIFENEDFQGLIGREILNPINEEFDDAIIVEIIVFMQLLSDQYIFNLNSDLFKKYLKLKAFPQLIDTIFNWKKKQIEERLVIAFGLAEILIKLMPLPINEIKKFISSILYWDHKLHKKYASNKNEFLTNIFDIIVTQIIYRLTRELLIPKENFKQFLDEINLEFNKEPLFNLGVLEAIATTDPNFLDNDQDLQNFLRNVINFFIKKTEQNMLNFHIMAFDIICNYERKNQFLGRFKTDFNDIADNVNWEDIFLKVRQNKSSKDNRELFKKWREIRKYFLFVLYKTPGCVPKRKPISEEEIKLYQLKGLSPKNDIL